MLAFGRPTIPDRDVARVTRSYMGYQMEANAVTLNDLEGHSQVAGLFKCHSSNILQHFTRFQLTVCSHCSSGVAELFVKICGQSQWYFYNWSNPPFLVFLSFGHSDAQDWAPAECPNVEKLKILARISIALNALVDSFCHNQKKVWDWKC